MKQIALALSLALMGCATHPSSPAPSAEGRIYHYLRSNQDGSQPENIWVYLGDGRNIEVYKWVERCARAALVTAEFDRESGRPHALIGGQVSHEGTQIPFAWLSYEQASLHARVPAMGLDTQLRLGGEPWSLFDFDFADITALYAGAAAPRTDLVFWPALIWPEEGATEVLRNMGETRARFAGDEVRLGRAAVRYDVSGGLNGALWLDAAEGYVVEARFAEPNHIGYADFKLTLEAIADGGEAEWRARLASHWQDCPAEE